MRVLISTTVAPVARAAKSSRRVARSEAPSTAPKASPTTPDRSPSSSAQSASISVAGATIRTVSRVRPKPPISNRPRSRNQARGAAAITAPRHAPSPVADNRNPNPAATPLAPSTHTSSSPVARSGAEIEAGAVEGRARMSAGGWREAEKTIVHYLFL